MLKNYLTIALRNLRKHKSYSFINIAGLAVGLACCILIALYVRNELSFDRFHERADRLYRVVSELQGAARPAISLAPTPSALAEVLKKDVPGIDSAVRLKTYSFFVDEFYNRQYASEQRVGSIFAIFAILAVFIACLGLFSLAAYATQQRTKEIGVRKVLGASVADVTALLSKDFVKLVLFANLIAWPVAWYAMNKWLQNFAYRIEISWWVFALAEGMALLIALLTVSAQSIRAALTNPIESLRYE